MTREQEITTMGAHSARSSDTGPITVARIATTTLAVAVTGAVGTGTALAHDEGSGHDGSDHQGGHGHSERSVDAGSAHGGTAALAARAEALRAQGEARETVRDALADLGMTDTGTFSDDSNDADGPDSDDTRGATVDGGADDTPDAHGGSADTSSGGGRAPASQPDHPSSGPRTTTQPIAAASNQRPASDGPLTGMTETTPIR